MGNICAICQRQPEEESTQMRLETEVSELTSSDSAGMRPAAGPSWHEEIEGQCIEDDESPQRCISVLEWDSTEESEEDEGDDVA